MFSSFGRKVVFEKKYYGNSSVLIIFIKGFLPLILTKIRLTHPGITEAEGMSLTKESSPLNWKRLTRTLRTNGRQRKPTTLQTCPASRFPFHFRPFPFYGTWTLPSFVFYFQSHMQKLLKKLFIVLRKKKSLRDNMKFSWILPERKQQQQRSLPLLKIKHALHQYFFLLLSLVPSSYDCFV